MTHDLLQIESQIGRLEQRCTVLSNSKVSELMQTIIRRPRFTTPTEFEFIMVYLESLSHQIQTVSSQFYGLPGAAERGT